MSRIFQSITNKDTFSEKIYTYGPAGPSASSESGYITSLSISGTDMGGQFTFDVPIGATGPNTLFEFEYNVPYMNNSFVVFSASSDEASLMNYNNNLSIVSSGTGFAFNIGSQNDVQPYTGCSFNYFVTGL